MLKTMYVRRFVRSMRSAWNNFISCAAGLAALLSLAEFPFSAALAESNLAVIADRHWVKVQADQFSLYSSSKPWVTREVFEDLQIRAMLLPEMAELRQGRRKLPVEFFLFGHSMDKIKFASSTLDSSASKMTMRGFTAMIAGARSSWLTDVSQQYSHFRLRETDFGDYPLWYEYGFIGHLGKMRIKNGFFGADDAGAALVMGWRPSLLREVINSKFERLEYSPGRSFENGAWALFHLLQHRKGKDGYDFNTATKRYLEAWRAGDRDQAAFEREYGVTLKSLPSEGVKYGYTFGRLPRQIPVDVEDPRLRPFQPEPMNSGEIAERLAGLALQWERVELAERLYDEALVRGLASGRREVQCTLARIRSRDLATGVINAAFTANESKSVQSLACLLDHGQALLNAARRSESKDVVAEAMTQLRTIAHKAIALDRHQAEAFALFGLSYLLPGQEASRAIEPLEVATKLVYLDHDLRADLMRAYAVNNRCEAARVAAYKIIAWAGRRSAAYGAARRVVKTREERCNDL